MKTRLNRIVIVKRIIFIKQNKKFLKNSQTIFFTPFRSLKWGFLTLKWNLVIDFLILKVPRYFCVISAISAALKFISVNLKCLCLERKSKTIIILEFDVKKYGGILF